MALVKLLAVAVRCLTISSTTDCTSNLALDCDMAGRLEPMKDVPKSHHKREREGQKASVEAQDLLIKPSKKANISNMSIYIYDSKK